MNSDQLIRLVYQKDYPALRDAVARGENLNCVDKDGRTPLMHATLAVDSDEEMIRFLVDHGASPNHCDTDQKWTSLHFAVRDQKEEIVRALLECGSDVDAEDIFGNTPLWRCSMTGKPNLDIARLLLDKGADPHKKNRHGASPRDVAERTGKRELVALFNQ